MRDNVYPKTLVICILCFLVLVSCSTVENVKPDFIFQETNFEFECLTSQMETPSTHQSWHVLSLTMNIKNTCQNMIEAYISNSELLVTQLDGTVLWQSSEGAISPAILPPPTTISPDETLEYKFTWDGRDWNNKKISTGTYQLVGLLNVIAIDSSNHGNIETVKQFELIE